MGKITNGPKLPNFCLSRIRPLVKVRSPTIQSKSIEAEKGEQKKKGNNDNEDHGVKGDIINGGDDIKPGIGSGIGRKIMIVVDSSVEAKTALQWTLSHTVQSQDKLVLLHVTKNHVSSSISSAQGKVEEMKKERAPRGYEIVYSLRKMCLSKRPEIEIEVAVVQGKEKGPTIVEEAKKQGVSMLVLGQKKKSVTTWRLLVLWTGQRASNGIGFVDYCVQNADCMAVAVRRKNRRHGGYLITTKSHKDFWLLA